MTTMELKAEYLRLSDLVGRNDDTLRRAVQALKRVMDTVKPVQVAKQEDLPQKRKRLAFIRQQKLDGLLRSDLDIRNHDLTVMPRTHEMVASMPRLAADFDYKETIAKMAMEETL